MYFIQCKIENVEKAIQIASIIQKTTNYSLLSSRPTSSSFESKKELLLSISPSLQIADKIRKNEEWERQEFTRCRVIKSSKKHVYYEYIDIDTKMTLRPEDYENRYVLRFICSY